MMTWEEAVQHLRKDPAGQKLVTEAYLDQDLELNVKRFGASAEFKETKALLRKYLAAEPRILDIGPGNGIASVSFALLGSPVTCVEPDASATVGRGAIAFLKERFGLQELTIVDGKAEHLPFPDSSFDLVYSRQCMHHAQDLDLFVSEAARVLKKGGLFLAVRDHVVNNDAQLKQFLQEHPLHRYYGGEQAFSLSRYLDAIQSAGLSAVKVLGPLDSIINIAPRTKKELAAELRAAFSRKFRIPLPVTDSMLFSLVKARTKNLSSNAGRLYSFICRK